MSIRQKSSARYLSIRRWRRQPCWVFPDERWGERALAVIAPRAPLSDEAALAAELRTHCRARLAPYKCPKEIRFVAALPRNAMGKIQKGKLRASFAPD